MKTIPLEQLTDREKYIIAEYIYSYYQDILIKSDAQDVIDMFKQRGADVSNVKLEVHSVLNLIKAYTELPDRQELMQLYYAGEIKPVLK